MIVHLENERALLDEARVGNREAFEVLMRQYDKKISRLAFRITGNREDADDALQESFMKAYLNLRLFHGDSRFYTWLARIAVNEALTRLRKQVTHRQVSLEDNRRLADWGETPEQRYARTERQDLLREAMQELEPSLRTVVALRYLEDLSNDEIARQLSLSVPAVKSRLMRARIRLRQRLGQHLGHAAARRLCLKRPIEFPRAKVSRTSLEFTAPVREAAGGAAAHAGRSGKVVSFRRAA